MDIVAATNNRGKLDELRRLFEGSGHRILSMAEAGVAVNVNENGETFAQNAALKAKAVCAAAGAVALGDDSGLCIDALDGAPGIHSARFSGGHGDDEANNKKVMHLLERTPYAKRGAHFVCALVLAAPDGALLEAEGVCDGMIGLVAASGKNGFGYDPLFYYNNTSFADMDEAAKDAVSHRGNAVRALREQLDAFAAQHEPQEMKEE